MVGLPNGFKDPSALDSEHSMQAGQLGIEVQPVRVTLTIDADSHVSVHLAGNSLAQLDEVPGIYS